MGVHQFESAGTGFQASTHVKNPIVSWNRIARMCISVRCLYEGYSLSTITNERCSLWHTNDVGQTSKLKTGQKEVESLSAVHPPSLLWHNEIRSSMIAVHSTSSLGYLMPYNPQSSSNP
jgi:hypothetical protein